MTIQNSKADLHKVYSVTATQTPDVYILDVDLTDMEGERYRCDYASAPDDKFGLAPTIRKWLVDNEGQYEIAPYVAPTVEQVRGSMPAISRVDFRKAFKDAGMTTTVIEAAIATVEDADVQEDYQIDWEDAQSFKRLDPLVQLVATYANKTPEEIDAIWKAAQAIV
ncbi:hypothetical protein QM996_02605 [Sinorhizobium chiapasense]